jgi:hypothetical protein
MTNNDESRSLRIIAFAVPLEMASATRDVAQKSLCSISYVCRRALLRDLKERGLLPEMEFA